MSLVLAIAFSFGSNVPHTVVPSTFVAGRAFAMPLVADSLRRLVLWIDTDGSGFIRSGVTDQLHLQATEMGGAPAAYLPRFDTPDFPPPTENHGALPILSDAQIGTDPILAGIDGQLGATWLTDRIWTFDYVHQQIWLDHAAPSYHASDIVPLQYDRMHQYPRIGVNIDGRQYTAALDTGATVVLNDRARSLIGGSDPAVRATSFVLAATLKSWHTAHPDWLFMADGGVEPNVSIIRVPEVNASHVVFRNVWFSTRPSDDVFRQDAVDLKLGPTAYGSCVVMLDYVHDVSGFQC